MPESSETLRPSPVPSLRIGFEGGPPQGNATTLKIAAPWLGGVAAEEIFGGLSPIGGESGLKLYRCGGLLIGHLRETFRARELARQTEEIYRRMLTACTGQHLFRIWNYVPRINGLTDGLENYRAFCLGRSLAFEAGLGRDFAARLPAASAVGCLGESIDVIFVAGESTPVHFENPAQVPAYQYPVEHGPRAPSFARATVAHDGGRTLTFISGTAAIRGHETVAPGSLGEQLDCTLENLRLISSAAGLGEQLGAHTPAQRFFKIYLRHAADFAVARARLERALLLPRDSVVYLQADICREALDVEIEATLVSGGSVSGV